jgi:hypothetical protein
MPLRKDWVERGKTESGNPLILCVRCHQEPEHREPDTELNRQDCELYCSHCNVVLGAWVNNTQMHADIRAFVTPHG